MTTATTTTKANNANSNQRRVKITKTSNGHCTIEITQKNKPDAYHCFEVAADSGFGRCFRLRKFGLGLDEVDRDGTASHYDLEVKSRGYSCECMGYLRHGKCKHGDAIVKLIESDRL